MLPEQCSPISASTASACRHPVLGVSEHGVMINSNDSKTFGALQKIITTFSDDNRIKSAIEVVFKTIKNFCCNDSCDHMKPRISFEAIHDIIGLLQEVAKRTISPKKFNFYSALKKYNYDKLEWEITPKERIYMKTPHKIFCGTKCSENDECGGFVFHEDTGTFDFIYEE